MISPELIPGASFYYEAFHTLGTDRQLGFNGRGPLPYSSVRAFSEGLAYPEVFAALMRTMDGVYLKHYAEKAEKAAQANQRGG